MKALVARIRHLIFKIINRILVFPEPETISGPQSLKRIPELLADRSIEQILIVTDDDLVKIGLAQKLTAILENKNINYTVFSDIKPNPTLKNLEEGLKVYLDHRCEALIAFGGGSPMDCAKIIAAKTTNKKPVKKMKGLFKVWHKLPFLICVPTTAGTGSEATIVAVITDPDNREKFAINSPTLTPDICILDPELLTGLPKHLTATTGMDALTHATEAYIGLIGNSYTDQLALKATKLIFDYLERSYQNGADLEAREAMLLAAHYAGKAFTRTYVGYVHAVAHNLGGFYGIPHGLANAVVLPFILELSKNKHAVSKMAGLARHGGLGSQNESTEVLAGRFIEKIKNMNENMAIPTVFGEIKESDIPELAGRIEREGNPTYPVPKLLWQKDFEELLFKLKA